MYIRYISREPLSLHMACWHELETDTLCAMHDSDIWSVNVNWTLSGFPWFEWLAMVNVWYFHGTSVVYVWYIHGTSVVQAW